MISRHAVALAAVGAVLCIARGAEGAGLALTPPMGWMSWEVFRCEVDCADHPSSCINDQLYKTMADLLASDGYLAAGYNAVHIDDCWTQKEPPRDPTTKRLVPDPKRFPTGMKALGDYVHAKGVDFALYTAESNHTCGGYPGSEDHEEIDAQTFASWGVDYMKVDGCNPDTKYYNVGYPAMGKALLSSGRNIVYSCSWPAYEGSNETTKSWPAIKASHCNLWRNWDDIQCNWGSLSSIIEHWGEYGDFLATLAGPGHWNDPDMLIIGNDCITDDEARTQMAIWSIIAAPLIMGNDLRTVSASTRAILLNPEAIAVSQDKLGKMGTRKIIAGAAQIWTRDLANGDIAVAFYNSGDDDTAITLNFADLKLASSYTVRDIWLNTDLGLFLDSFTAPRVPAHGTAFVRMTKA